LPKAPWFYAAFNTVLNRGEDSFRLMPHRLFNTRFNSPIAPWMRHGLGLFQSCQVRTHQRLLFGVQAKNSMQQAAKEKMDEQ